MKWILTSFLVLMASNLLLAQASAQSFDKTISIPQIADANKVNLVASVFTNPTTEVLTIETKNNMIQRLEFYSLQGEKVQEASIDNAQKVTINLYSLRSGEYLLKLFTVKGIITKRFTKE